MKNQRVEQVFAACHQLESAQPEKWTRTDVRNLVGGSDRDLSTLIKAWKSLQPLAEQLPETPEALLFKLAEYCNQIFSEQQECLGEYEQQQRTILQTAVDDFAQQTQLLESEIQKCQHQIDEKSNLLLEAEQMQVKDSLIIENLQQQIAEGDRERNELLWKANQQEQQLLNKDRSLQQLTQQHQDQLQSLQAQQQEDKANLIAQSEKEQSRLMRLLAQDRDEHKLVLKTLNEQAIDEKFLSNQLQEKFLLLQKEQLKGGLEIKSLKETLRLNQQTIDQLALENSDLKSENNVIKAENSEIQSKNAQLLAVREDTTQESISQLAKEIVELKNRFSSEGDAAIGETPTEIEASLTDKKKK